MSVIAVVPDHLVACTTIGIVTALPREAAAVRAVIGNAQPGIVAGDPNYYITAELPSADPTQPHHIVVTILTRDGTADASAACANLLRSFPAIRHVIMCGVAGGIPDPDHPDRHVRLGDIVVATDIIDYDHVRHSSGNHILRRHLHPADAQLWRAARELQIKEYRGVETWEPLLRSYAGSPGLDARPPDDADVLHHEGKAVPHPSGAATGHRPGLPKVHHGSIGSANRLVCDAAHRDLLAARHGILAIEMESSGIATSTDLHGRHWFAVRGIVDYCDHAKNEAWHPYASLAAAVYLRSLVAQCHPAADRLALAERV